jgi:hypothetical protein
MLELNGKKYFGNSGWIGKSPDVSLKDVMQRHRQAGFKPNGNTPTHAEGHVFDQALLDQNSGGSARLFVDSTFCNSCGSPFKGVENMAKGLGLEKVDVYIRLPNGHLISGQITP